MSTIKCFWGSTFSFLDDGLAKRTKITFRECVVDIDRCYNLLIPLEKRHATQTESQSSTHDAQSQAGHDIIGDRRRKILRIGQWPARNTSPLFNSPIALETDCNIRRTGTDLQNEEENVGTARSRLHPGSHLQIASGDEEETSQSALAENAIPIIDSGLDLSRNYYNFEWFWILLGMMVLNVSAIISLEIFVLARLSSSIIGFWLPLVISISIDIVSFTLYTGLFVVLKEYHEVIEKAVIKYARLPRGLQSFCLRICAYVYAVGVVVCVIAPFTPFMYAS